MRHAELDEQARLLAERLERGGDPRRFLEVFPKRTQRAIIRRATRILEEQKADA